MPAFDPHGERVLILAPRGRDAIVMAQLLAKSDVLSTVCGDGAEWLDGLRTPVATSIVTEEALLEVDPTALNAWVSSQPPWSDFPFIMLATRQAGRRTASAAAMIERLGNVVLLERPINAETLLSAVSSALRVRRRQYQARQHIREREDAQQRLRIANETLERRVAERTREVEAARETLAFALDSAGMGSWDLDLVNDTARRSRRHDAIFGYDVPITSWGMAEFRNHTVPEDRLMVEAAFALAVETGTLDLEYRMSRTDGAIRWIAAKGQVEYGDDGSPIRMAGIVVDRTDQRNTEEALRQAQKMEAIGQLTGGVAHDFNNLLTVIVGGLDMMIRKPENTERVVRLAEAAMNAARRGEQLTQQLLAFSRRQMLRPQTINPNRLLTEFKPLAERAVGGALELRLDLDVLIDPIRIDPAQFEAAVLNLVVNARDAMEGGGSRIVVRSRNLHLDTAAVAGKGVPPGAYVEVAVIDQGSGIAPETMARVFEPFFTTKEVGKGTGLGLSQVYGFTRSAGGFIGIDTEMGAGTTFRLLFPRSAEPAGSTLR